jgi:hypothetical protein
VQLSEKLAPVAAVMSALSCMACCLPLGFAAAAGLAGVGVVLEPLRPWLMSISAVLLVFGMWQLYRRPKVCRPRSRASLIVFWTSAVVVVALTVAPQLVAGFLADYL